MTTYRITEKAKLHKSQVKQPPPYTVEANGYYIEDGLVTFYKQGQKLALATSLVQRIETVEETDQS